MEVTKLYKFGLFLTTMVMALLLCPLLPQEKTKIQKTTEELFKMTLEELMKVKVERSIRKQPCAKTWALIMLKIVSMDKNIERLGNPIDIGVSSNNLYITLKSLENKLKINGKPFITHKITSLKSAAQYKIIYLGKNWGRNGFTDMETLAENGCFIFCDDEKGLLFGSASVLFKVIDKYPHVAINLENAEDQGADFRGEELEAIVLVRGKD